MAFQDELRSVTAIATAQPTPGAAQTRPPMQPLQPLRDANPNPNPNANAARPMSAPAARARAAPSVESPGQQSDGSIGLGLGGSYGRVAHQSALLDYDVLHGGVDGATPISSQPSTPGGGGSYRRPVVPSPMVPKSARAGVPPLRPLRPKSASSVRRSG